nr:SEC-C domain-containing protein [Desulfobulbaceae bacterium]
MAKIGRNQPCPCGSGLKYKKCCLKDKPITTTAAPKQKISVTEEIKHLQELAVNRKESIKLIGVFIFVSTANGDGWLFELSEKDAVLVAKDGVTIDVDIEESDETIEINWSHQFVVSKGKVITTAYADQQEETHDNLPAAAIKDALLQMEKTFSSDLLNSIHLSDDKKE